MAGNVGDILKDWQKRNVQPTTREGRVLFGRGAQVQVRSRGATLVVRNNAGIPVAPGDEVMLVRERKHWAIQSVIASTNRTNPSQAVLGGGPVQPIAKANPGVSLTFDTGGEISDYEQISENVEFQCLRDRVLVCAHFRALPVTGFPGHVLTLVRAAIDETIYGPQCIWRIYQSANRDERNFTYMAVIDGLTPGDHILQFQATVNGRNPATFSTRLSTYGISVAGL